MGAQRIDTLNFGIPVQWLALERTQMHLFERDHRPTSHHRLGITVDLAQAPVSVRSEPSPHRAA